MFTNIKLMYLYMVALISMLLTETNGSIFILVTNAYMLIISNSKVCTVTFQLWVGPGSRAAKEKQFFDSHLAPFYRIEQVYYS